MGEEELKEVNIFSELSSESNLTPAEAEHKEFLSEFSSNIASDINKKEDKKNKIEAMLNGMASFPPVELGEAALQTNSPKVETYGAFSSAFRQYNPTDAILDYFKDKNFPPDPNFNPIDEPDFKSQPVQYIDELASSTSKAQYDWRKSQIEQGVQDNLKLQASGLTGTAAIMAASVLDPVSIASGILTGGVAWASKSSRLANAVKTGLLTSAEATALESIVVSGNQTRDENDVLYASVGGMLLGGGFGAFTGKASKTLNDMKTKMDEDLIQELRTGKSVMDSEPEDFVPSSVKVEEDDIGLVKEPRVNTDEELIQQARSIWKEFNPKELKGLAKTLLRLDYSDAGRLLKHKSDVVKAWTTQLAEHGLGSFKRQKTASALQDLFEKQILSPTVDVRSVHFKGWATKRGITKLEEIAKPQRLQEFYREVMQEMQTRRNMFQNGMPENSILASRAKNADKDIFNAANAFQESYDIALDTMKKNNVAGFADVERIIGYFPLRWSGQKMGKYSDKAVISLISKGYKTVGIEDKIADKIAKAVFNRSRNNDLGFDTNPNHLFDADARSFFRQMLKDNGVGEDELENLFSVIDKKAKERGKAKFAKSRTDIDLLQTNDEGLSILDLIDTDLGTMTQRYSRESAGRSGLGRYGITNDADVNKIKAIMVKDASDSGIPLTDSEKETIEALFAQLTGKPVGKGLNPLLRNVKQFQNLASLHTTGWIAQTAEMANFVALHGVQETIRNVSGLKSFIRDVKTGKISNEILSEFEVASGIRIGDEHLMFRTDIYIDDSVALGSAKVDNALGQASHALGYLNGMNQVKRAQDRMAINAMTNKIAKLAINGASEADIKRLADIGISKTDFKKIQQNIKKFASFNERGNVTKLDLAKWDSQLVENWTIAMNRNTNQLFQRAAIGEDFYWASKNFGSLITQFMRYPMVAIGKQTLRNVRLADPTSAAVLLYSMAFASAATATKIHFNSLGRSDRKDFIKKRFSPEAFASQTINLVGALSILPTGVSALGAITGLEAINIGNHGRSDLQRSADIGIDIIPTGSLVNNAVNITRGAVNLLSGEGSTKQQVHSAIRTIPFNGIIGFKQLINLGTDQNSSVPRNR